MAKLCSICRRDDRDQIDQSLLDGESYRAIAARTGTSIAALHRHRWQHLSTGPVNATQVGEEIRAESFRERFDAIKRAGSTILARSLQAGKYGMALQAMTRMENHLKLEAELLTKLRDSLINSLGLRVSESVEEKPDLDLLSPDELRTILALLDKPKRLKAA